MRNRYLQSVTEAGGIPVVLPLSVSWDDVSWLLGRVDGFLIMGATDLLARVLGKNPATTSVIIEDVPPENWGIGGLNTPERRKREAGKRKGLRPGAFAPVFHGFSQKGGEVLWKSCGNVNYP